MSTMSTFTAPSCKMQMLKPTSCPQISGLYDGTAKHNQQH